jgi:hypothetical protein
MVAARGTTFSLNFQEALSSIFRDPDWLKKLALGALFSILGLLIVGGIIIQGYLLILGERVARAESRPLPEWDDFGELLRKGGIGFVVSLAYSLPLIGVGILLGLFLIPLFVSASSPAANPDALFGVFFLGYCGGLAILFPLSLVISIVLPAAHAQLILHNHDLGAAFRFREVFGFIRRHPGQYTLMTVLVLAAHFGFSQLAPCTCYISLLVTTFVTQLFQYHLLGQLCWYERLTLGQQPVMP